MHQRTGGNPASFELAVVTASAFGGEAVRARNKLRSKEQNEERRTRPTAKRAIQVRHDWSARTLTEIALLSE